jgi:hypothetical protein
MKAIKLFRKIERRWRLWLAFWNERQVAQETDAAFEEEEEANEGKGQVNKRFSSSYSPVFHRQIATDPLQSVGHAPLHNIQTAMTNRSRLLR